MTSKRNMRVLLVFAAICQLISTVSIAASFDCRKAQSFREHTVCSDAQLSSLDEQLNAAYKSARAASTNPMELKDTQKAWMASANQCADVACLAVAYQNRLSQLRVVGGSDAGSAESPPVAESSQEPATTTPSPVVKSSTQPVRLNNVAQVAQPAQPLQVMPAPAAAGRANVVTTEDCNRIAAAKPGSQEQIDCFDALNDAQSDAYAAAHPTQFNSPDSKMNSNWLWLGIPLAFIWWKVGRKSGGDDNEQESGIASPGSAKRSSPTYVVQRFSPATASWLNDGYSANMNMATALSMAKRVKEKNSNDPVRVVEKYGNEYGATVYSA